MGHLSRPSFMQPMGDELVAYLLNIDPSHVKDVFLGGYGVTAAQEEVWRDFVELCTEQRRAAVLEKDVDQRMYGNIAKRFDAEGNHILTAYRIRSGGELPEVSDEDQIVAYIKRIALAAYPMFLMTSSERHEGGRNGLFDLVGHCVSKKLYGDIEELVRADECLAKVFFSDDPRLNNGGYYYASSGHGSNLLASSLPSKVIKASTLLLIIMGRVAIDEMMRNIGVVLNMIRQLAKGEEIEVPMVMGYANAFFENFDSPITTSVGELVPYSSGVLHLLSRSALPSRAGQEGESIGFIVRRGVGFRARFEFEGKPDKDFKKTQEINMFLPELVGRKVSTAFALGSNREEPVGVVLSWAMVFDPLAGGPNMTIYASSPYPLPYYSVDGDNAESISRWLDVVVKEDDREISVAISRMLLAMKSRSHPSDGFVDVVIAWESLFGGRDNIAYRVSTSIANLIGTDLEDRKKIRTEVNKFYNHRSKLVHGGVPKNMTVPEHESMRNRCLNILIECLKKLYEECPELLHEKDRSLLIGLGYSCQKGIDSGGQVEVAEEV